MKAVLFQSPTGTLHVAHLADNARADGETESAFAARMAASLAPPSTPYFIVEATALPSAPFEQWVIDWQTGAIAIDPLKGLTVTDYEAAIQAHIEETAKARGYRDAVTLASYVASTVASWAAEAQVFIPWRDAVWLYAYGELAKVQGGQRVQPSVNELIAELPAMIWPE